MATSITEPSAPAEGMLSPFRVLDLTEGGCTLGGKMLADFGADVIKIEPPGGSPSRRIGPFWRDQVHPERSLFWWAYNVGKRSITLDIATADGAAIFRRLVQSADFVLESFSPGQMDGVGLGYEALSQTNPRIIVTSITPFGSTGPKSGYAWCDLTVWSSGGPVYMTGDPEKPPVTISFMHQAALNAGAEAAAASMIAHYYRQRTGEGQHVDVSMQEVAYWIMTSWPEFWETEGIIPRRFGGPPRPSTTGGNRERRLIYPAKDGYVAFWVQGGRGATVESTRSVLAWMKEEGEAAEWLLTFNWEQGFDLRTMAPETLDAMEQCFADFLATKTKAEISQRAVANRIMIGAVNTSAEVAEHPHLRARDFFQEVWHEELGEKVTYCSSAMKVSGAYSTLRRRPPQIGEHNAEVYGRELGLLVSELTALRHASVI